ncbi:Metacaspase-9 [Raphanus sativus]|uniref:Metacaspase-9 n=1 Tax=Raphanus sativus TaxID=3726 RepID=A0A6J0K4P0_RAPSA|nr:metacaspase-9 [Raphanus sativus]KAJ4882402.1 Metacaspase-9 [Raphanus sativus]
MEQQGVVKRRLAVLVGCNYPDTRNELHGCVNDVLAMKETLLTRFGFKQEDMEVLTDEPESKLKPTGANIKAALSRMVEKARNGTGDVLFFHYSGHGTRIPSVKPAHPFRQDEAIVPCDFNLITDVDFRELVNQLPKGTSFTMISDSCHSGGLIDKEKEQIGPFSSGNKSLEMETTTTTTLRTLPFKEVLDHLSSLTGILTSDIGTHLLELFGVDAGLKFRLPTIDLMDLLEKLTLRERHVDSGILLSGCQADETSADVGGEGGKAYGAFSNAIQTVLKENGGGALKNKELVLMAREVLEKLGFQQHPCLYCSDQNAESTFLSQP